MKYMFLLLLILTPAALISGENEKPVVQDKKLQQLHPLNDFFEKNANNIVFSTVKTPLVQNELALTDEQKDKIFVLQKEKRKSWSKIYGANPTLSAQEQVNKLANVDTDLKKKVYTILKPNQIHRLHEIFTQLSGVELLPEEEAVKLLGLKKDQKEVIDSHVDYMEKTRRKIRTSLPPLMAKKDEDIRRRNKECFKKIQKVKNEVEIKVDKILTANQRDILKKMKGKEIDLGQLFEELADTEDFP